MTHPVKYQRHLWILLRRCWTISHNKKSTPIQLQSLDALFGDIDTEQTGVQEISLDNLHPFPGHPFKVEESKHIEDLCESVKTYGVLSTGIVRVRGRVDTKLSQDIAGSM